MSSERRGAVRIFTLFATAAVAAWAGACANVSEPPGGPPDVRPPSILGVTPDSGAIVARPREVVVQFDEVISETPQGAQDIASLVFISPKSGTPEVDWSRSRIAIRPSRGWRANTVYTVEIRPGLADLRNNVIDSTIRVVFSTGGAIPNTRLSGAAFDWAAGRHAPAALVEAIAPDSTTYQTLADSSGRYELRALPPGPYVVRAVLDRNLNRELEPLEPWDTVSVTVVENSTADLYTFQHDTVGVRISEITLQDSARTLRVVFDKPLAPGQTLTPDRIVVQRADSTRLTVARVYTAAERAAEDSARARTRADSIARATTDTSAAGRARADSIARRRAADSIAAAERAERERRRLEALRGGRPARRDTTPPPKFDRPRVSAELFVTLAEPLPDASRFRLQVLDVRSLSGTVKSPTRDFTTPRRPPADSTRR